MINILIRNRNEFKLNKININQFGKIYMNSNEISNAINLNKTKEEIVVIVDKENRVIGNTSRYIMVIRFLFF